MTNVNDPNSRREFPQEAEGSSFNRATWLSLGFIVVLFGRRCVLGVPERRHAGGGQQSSWRRAQDADGNHRPKAHRQARAHHQTRRRPRTVREDKHRAFDGREGAPPMRGIFFTISPSRCASASSHTAPTSSSDSPTAAEPMSLTVPICGIDFTRHPVGKLFDRGVEQLDHHQQDDDADQRQARPCGLTDQEGERDRTRRTATSCRNAASVRIAALSPFQELMVARSSRSMAAEFSPTRGTQASGYPRKSTCA